MQDIWQYVIHIRRDTNGSFVANIPEIASCHAQGQTPEEALRELYGVFEMIKEEYETSNTV